MVDAFVDVEGARRSRERIEKGREKVREEQLANEYKEATEMVQKRDQHARHVYIEEHKSEIIVDYLAGGYKTVAKNWKVSPGGWSAIRERWASDIAETVKRAQGKMPATEVDWKAEYMALKQHFDGYRQAVLDMVGQQVVDTKDLKD